MNAAMPMALFKRALALARTVVAGLAIGWLATTGSAAAVDLLDGNEDFKLMASAGFSQALDGAHPEGTPSNDYAWSMAWFKGKLYVGTGQFESDAVTGLPGAGQIWAYTPGGADGSSGTWALAYAAPASLTGPREFGYRWMTQCSFRGQDYLFISTLGVFQGNILYTTDGVTFNTVSRAGFPNGSIGFRTMVCFTEASGRRLLVTSPVGQLSSGGDFDSDRSGNPIALANADPTAGGPWQNYSVMGMGDANNDSLFTMYGWNGYLYAGVSNEVTGGQLWRTRGCQVVSPRLTCMPSWSKVIDRGGGRPPNSNGVVGNKGFSDMIAFGNSLYLALSGPALDRDRIRAELWRLRSDDTFEVLIGEPRLNVGSNSALPGNLRCGLPLETMDATGSANDCPPTTRRGAGLGAVGDAAGGYPQGSQLYFWRLYNYVNSPATPKGDGRLYLGTLDGSRRGFRILASGDGVDWATVTQDGVGFPQQQGMRSIAGSPYGLFIGGTHFPFGIGNEIRGCNVWLGVPLADSLAPVTSIASPPSPGEGDTLSVRTATFSWNSVDTPAPGSLPLTYAYRLDPVESAFSAFGAATTRTYNALANGTYTFHVIARDNAGNTEAPGAGAGASNRRTFSVNAPDLPPSVSITVAPASPSTTGNAVFAWAGSDDVTPAASLVYDRWLAPLQSDPGTFAGGTGATYTGLADGTYTFHVVPKDGAGNIGVEATATFSVAIPPGPPGVPSPASATLIAPRTVRVTWADVSGESSYTVQRCINQKVCVFATIAPNVAADTTQLDDFIPAGAGSGNFGYRVQACNGSGCSGWATSAMVFVP